MAETMKKAVAAIGAEAMAKALQYSFNVTPDTFKSDLVRIIDAPGHVSDAYAQDMYRRMRDSFTSFYCNLDEGAKRRFMETALVRYGIGM